MRRWWRTLLYWVLTIGQWGAALALVAIGAVPRDLSKLSPVVLQVLGGALSVAQRWTWLVIPLAFVSGLAKLLREKLGSPWKWDLVKNVLDTLREVTFKEVTSADPVEFHRATLFKHERICFTTRCVLLKKWPFGGWLVTVERSGHFTRQAREAFWAPDQAEYAHGVAGRTWATQRVLPIINLPDPSDETHIADYARQSFVPLAWVRKTNERARSYFGIPIEVRGRPWGVVVLDSRDPCPPGVVETLDGDIQVAKHIAYAYSTAARALGKILEPH